MRKRALPRKRFAAGFGIALATASAPAQAQIDARTWRPSSDADASLVLEPAVTAGPGRWNVGVYAQYAQDPVVFRPATAAGGQPGPPLHIVQHSVGLDVVAGLGLGTRFAVGVDVPMALWQDGQAGNTPPVTATAVGDVGLTGKATLLSNDRQGVHSGFGLAALGTVFIPTRNDSDVSDFGLGAELEVLAEYAVGIGALRATLGFSNRDQDSWPLGPGTRVLVPGGVAFGGNSVPWAFGLVVRPKVFAEALDNGDRQLWEIAAHGSLPAGPVAPFGIGAFGASVLSPALLSFDDRVALGHNRELFVLAGGEIGLDGAIGVPAFRAVVSMTWAPRSHDKDGDGVDDEKDQCPDLPEDRDGLQDADGCPEDDADGDSILDQDDACPLVPGVASTDPKKNGCPGEAPAPPAPGAPEAPPTPAPVPPHAPIEEKTP
jgi:OOP family OmpA-OmpF porin